MAEYRNVNCHTWLSKLNDGRMRSLFQSLLVYIVYSFLRLFIAAPQVNV